MKVKGSIFIDLVKMIKKDKSGVFDKYLTDQDREIISHKLLLSVWYPYETYKHCIIAIFEVVAKKNPEVAKKWGREVCQTVMTNLYAAFVSKRDPISFLKKYEMIHKNFYDFGKIDVMVEKENQVLLKLSDLDAQCVPIYYIMQGWVERGMELCGAKNIKTVFVTKSWEGQPNTSLRFTWTL